MGIANISSGYTLGGGGGGGSPTTTAATAPVGNSTTLIANTAFVQANKPQFTKSAIPPVAPSIGDYWLDTDDNRIYMRVDDGGVVWMQVS